MEYILLILLSGALGAGGVFAFFRFMQKTKTDTIISHTVAERVRAVGKLVGLEVTAKEIVTRTSGWAWLPPILLSQARLAMIFHFEKQYSVDLARVKDGQVEQLGERSYRITLPAIDGTLRLLDVTPYDIQDGRILGLLDIIPMNADRQRELMRQAQEQAAKLFTTNDARYLSEARRSIERHLRALLGMFDITVELRWADETAEAEVAERETVVAQS